MPAPLKDLFDREVVELLAARFSAVDPVFEGDRFARCLLEAFPRLELKERINLVADQLAAQLPKCYPDALRMVVAVADTPVDGFAAWPLCSFVERHGVDHPDLSLEAMESLTIRMSCEFAIRPFLDHHLDHTLRYLERWVDHEHPAVRRLVSEGTRPRLPWGPRVAVLLERPEIGLELLERLRHDESEDVRRSVANHLNDVAKDHPAMVTDVLRRWSADSVPPDPAMIRHALRTLVKRGDPAAMELLGFSTDAEVDVESFTCSPERLRLGDRIELTAVVTSAGDSVQKLVIDFVIHHVTKKGGISPKVFKWSTIDLAPGESVTLTKRRTIATASTRRYSAGFHAVDLQVAGQVRASAGFHLENGSE